MKLGAYAVERDYSHYVAYATKTVLAIVGTASKGPVNQLSLCTSTQDLVTKFGQLKTDCYGLYAAQYFLSQASKLYFVRAAGVSACASTASITGLDTSSKSDIHDGLVLRFNEIGTFSNDYSVLVEAADNGDYNFYVRNDKGTTIEAIKSVPLVDLVEGYKTTNFTVESVDPSVATLQVGQYKFANGNDGISDITDGDYNTALQELLADTCDMNIMAVPGISSAAVIVEGLKVCETRGDTLYIIDPPKGLDRDAVIKWRNGSDSFAHAAFNSSYGAVYYDWIKIYDSKNKVTVEVPPSVAVCETYAFSDRNSQLWYAPAGLTRGILRGVIDVNTHLKKSDVELLYEEGINSIYDDPQVGLVLWGQKTLYNEDTALNRVNVRRLMNYLKRVVVAACNYLIFEPNDRITWNAFEMRIKPTLESVKANRGLYEYKIVKGETIVTDTDIDNYRMPCMIMVRPTKAAEEIPVYFVITSTGADFNEVLEANGVIVDAVD